MPAFPNWSSSLCNKLALCTWTKTLAFYMVDRWCRILTSTMRYSSSASSQCLRSLSAVVALPCRRNLVQRFWASMSSVNGGDSLVGFVRRLATGDSLSLLCLTFWYEIDWAYSFVTTSVATAWVFSQDLGFFEAILGSWFFSEGLGFFLGFSKGPWVFLGFFKICLKIHLFLFFAESQTF